MRILAKRRKAPPGIVGRIYAALLAGPLCGCEAYPLRHGELRKLRRQAADFRRHSCRSGSQDLLWAVQRRGTDLECRHLYIRYKALPGEGPGLMSLGLLAISRAVHATGKAALSGGERTVLSVAFAGGLVTGAKLHE